MGEADTAQRRLSVVVEAGLRGDHADVLRRRRGPFVPRRPTGWPPQAELLARKELREQGIDLDSLDADHGLPRSKGGADHPLNYEMIDSSLNRSLGNDVLRKLMVHPAHLLQGAAVSALMRLRCSPQL